MDVLQRQEFLAGVKAELPIVVGVAPFGMIFGAIAVTAGIPALLSQSMSTIIFAGSAQFIAAELMGAGTPLLILLMTTFVVNLRHLLYSASLAEHVRFLPLRWKMLLAYLMTDEAYAVTVIHYTEDDSPATHRHWFFLGAGLTLWVSWQTTTALGILLGARIPPGWSLDFALPVTFIAIAVPALRDRPHIGAAIAAGLMAVATHELPYQLWLIAASLAGVLVGITLERFGRAPRRFISQQEGSTHE
ncbi:MAG: AzlC family ABC transporter permease [Anaerolineae bacterium]|nr:AzlC family ABC transporter permease [Anaerolineae bacterium]HNS39853.1 AzlC family ABC transporter permease [Promineifilum sp.]